MKYFREVFFFEEILECLSLEMINLSEQDLSS